MTRFTHCTQMMNGKISYDFSATIWQHASPASWYFVSLPKDISTEIRANLKWMEEGWGRLKASAKIGHSQWDTAIWFDTKHDTFILPLKADIRKKEHLIVNQMVDATIYI